MYMNLSLCDISCLLSFPKNFNQHNVAVHSSDFYQHPSDLGRFLDKVMNKPCGFTELIHTLSNRYWHKYKSFFFHRGICEAQELPGKLITLLLKRLESTERKPEKGLTCPKYWYQYSYNWGGFLYVVFNNLLKGFLDLGNPQVEDSLLPEQTQTEEISGYDLISQQEVQTLKGELPKIFVQTSEILYHNLILSPQRHLLFSCFHSPQMLSNSTLNSLLQTFPKAQPKATTLFMNSRYAALTEVEPHRFAKRCTFLAWLLFGKSFSSIADMELHQAQQIKTIKRDIHRAKNHSKKIVFRHLAVVLLTMPSPLGFEGFWKALQQRMIRYTESADTPNIKERLASLSTHNVEDVYTVLFTYHESFAEWNRLNKRQAQRAFQNFYPLHQQISMLLYNCLPAQHSSGATI